MSKAFIAWSGNHPFALALAEHIGKQNKGVECIVGGSSVGGIGGRTVFDTIMEQMKQCDQAILLVQKHPVTGKISPNLMFEWGHLMAKLSPNKVHNFFIDLEENDPEIPSDLRGVWATSVSTKEKEQSEVIKEIAEHFFKAQYFIIPDNKMTAIMEWYRVKDYISRHDTDPACSDFELAQYVLCYIYSAHIFTNIADDVEDDLRILSKKLGGNCANELRMAIRTARNTLNLFKAIHSTSDNIYLLYKDFDEINDAYQDLLSEVETLEESELKLYMRALINDFVAFAELMMLYSPDTEGEERALFADKLIEDSESVIADCNAITEANFADNKQFCWLLRSYMYRGMFCALEEKKRLVESGEAELDDDPVEREEKMKEYLRLSLEERTQLYREYQDGNVNGIFFENVEMEYYLALAEYYPYEKDKLKKNNYSRKLKGYVEKTKRIENEKNVFIRKILGYIERS